MQDDPGTQSGKTAEAQDKTDEVGVVSEVLELLSKTAPDARKRILQTVATFFGVGLVGSASSPSAIPEGRPVRPPASAAGRAARFSEDRSISPKQFMLEKQPKTDVERVACLGYYLTHYRELPHFKTLDVSKLNTEAAQVKFSNASVAVDNAAKRNYLVQASRGTKQISALGEQFVQALPDREKAKSIMAAARPRRRSRKRQPANGEQAEN